MLNELHKEVLTCLLKGSDCVPGCAKHTIVNDKAGDVFWCVRWMGYVNIIESMSWDWTLCEGGSLGTIWEGKSGLG